MNTFSFPGSLARAFPAGNAVGTLGTVGAHNNINDIINNRFVTVTDNDKDKETKMKQSPVIGQGINKGDSVNVVENKTPVEKAVAVTGPTLPIVDNNKVNRHGLEMVAGLLKIALPEHKARTAPADRRYKWASAELVAHGLQVGKLLDERPAEFAKTFRPLPDFGKTANKELLTMSLLQYFKRTSTSIKRTQVTGQDTVIYQVVVRPAMTVVDSREFKVDDWKEQSLYLEFNALKIAVGYGFITDGKAVYAAFAGRKKVIFIQMQELAEVKPA